MADIAIEDSVYTTLHDGTVESTYTVLASPVKTENYLNGEYEEKFSMYLANETQKLVEFFCPSEK